MISALVLAGGASRRYADNKLLSAHPQGGTLIEHVLDVMLPQAKQTLVVTGKWHEALSPVFADKPLTVSFNENWESGMGTSIAHGVNKIQHLWPETTHIFICVSDLPAITESSLAQLAEVVHHYPDHIVASSWRETVGVPAIFPLRYFPQLGNLNGDRGAGALIKEAMQHTPVGVIVVPHAEAGWDIDTPADWQSDNN